VYELLARNTGRARQTMMRCGDGNMDVGYCRVRQLMPATAPEYYYYSQPGMSESGIGRA
jgi:hypothetical protein